MSHASKITNEELEETALASKNRKLSDYFNLGLPVDIRHQKLLDAEAAAAKAATTSKHEGSDRGHNHNVQERIKMCSEKTRKWINLNAKLDTGTPENWISPSVVKQLGLDSVEDPAHWTTFTGESWTSDSIVRATWCAKDTKSDETWDSDFRIGPPDAPFEVLFGEDFIMSDMIYIFKKDIRKALILTKKKDTKEDQRLMEAKEKEVEAKAKRLEDERKANEGVSNGESARASAGKDKGKGKSSDQGGQ